LGLTQVKGDGDTLLEPNEQFTVTIFPGNANTTLTVNKKFTVEMKPQVGGVLLLERSVPGQIDTSNLLY
jgi:archaellin